MSNLGNTVSQRVNPASLTGLAFGNVGAVANVAVPIVLTPDPGLVPARDLAIVAPVSALAAGVTLYARITASNTIQVIAVNASAGIIAVGNMDVVLHILKGTGQQLST